MEDINTYLFSGFLDSGKTTYIMDAIFHDYFYKRGKTLIISFEDGEISYDVETLENYNTFVEIYEDGEDITAFCLDRIEKHHPDRIYIEENVMIDNLKDHYPSCMKIVAKTVLISGESLSIYYNNLKQQLQTIVADAKLVIFNRVDDVQLLKNYGNGFKLLNNKASYLCQNASGYHEKAFGVMVNYDKMAEVIRIGENDYADFYLDCYEDPKSYTGKNIELSGTIRYSDDLPKGRCYIGNMVMTCCLADMQFIQYQCLLNGHVYPDGSKALIIAKVILETDPLYHRQYTVFDIQ